MDTKRLTVLSGALQDIKDVLSGPDDTLFRLVATLPLWATLTAKPMRLYGSKGEAEPTMNNEARGDGITNTVPQFPSQADVW